MKCQPCLYDPYGMTIMEAAAFGAPSIVNGGGKVGAASILGEGRGCIAVDLERILDSNDDDDDEARREIAERLRMLLEEKEDEEEEEGEAIGRYYPLRQTANEARSRALGWDEIACSRVLVDILNGLPPS
jgi:glycosyltransferase involved in cell wall biosynthesis